MRLTCNFYAVTTPMKTDSSSAAVLETAGPTPVSVPAAEINKRYPLSLTPAHAWRQWVAFDHCRVLLRQFVFARSREPLAQLYRLSLDEGEPRASASASARFWARIIFAVVALRQVLVYFRRYSTFVKHKYGVPRLRQFRDLWYCAWRQNQSPRHYYWRQLYLIADRKTWLENLEHRQVNTLLNHLNRNLPILRATDKAQFYQHCLSHKLPTAPILANWDNLGNLMEAVSDPVAADLFLKPGTEYGSVGIMPIVYHAATATYAFKNAELSWSDLLAAIGRMSREGGRSMILQRRLTNAVRNGIYGDADICNVRIVTGMAPGHKPEVIGAFIRLPSSLTTTGHDRNIMISSIDVATGRMDTGRFRETMLGDFPMHPDTGAPIENRILPGWTEMVELAFKGHRSYPWLPFIGWDVVDTKDGLLLLEANAYWGGDCVQLPGAMPLGRTQFAEIYLRSFEHFYGPSVPEHRFPIK
jgi:putative polysaccharide biosynthesis protein